MSTSTITVGGQTVTLVSLPASPERREVQFDAFDAVALVPSEFTGQAQAQQWPGADMLSGTMTLPPLTQVQADDWISFLMQCRGMANAFQIGDPLQTAPRGSGAGSPVTAVGVGVNPPGAQSLQTSGWTPGASGVLLRGDWLETSYRLYRALDDVNADGSGNATIPIWPSLREQPGVLGNYWLGGLVGAFADSGGNVLQVVFIGNGLTMTAPAGATQLQLGVNDDKLVDETGSWVIAVNGTNQTVVGTSMPWVTTGGLNPGMPWGLQDGTSPVAVAVTAGTTVTVAYVSGLVNVGGTYPSTDANGNVGSPAYGIGSSGTYPPAHYAANPTASAALILNNPKGLFRLGSNKRTWSADVRRATSISFPIQEYR